MSNEVAYSTLAHNYEKLKLDDYAMFDRIINLKLKVRGSSRLGQGKDFIDEFIIRSDYEIVHPSDSVKSVMNGTNKSNGYYIQKCAYKPSIKVQYAQVSGGTSIGIDIFVNNFFITTKDGRHLMSFSNADYKMYQIEVLMGYIGQFNKCLRIEKGDVSHLKADDLFNFDNVGHGVQKLTVTNVEYVQTDKLPPDSVLHIHGYVGDTIQSQFGKPESVKYETLEQNAQFSNRNTGKSLEELIFKYITRRYTNFPDKAKYVDGFMSEEEARRYGVQVFCTKAVQDLELPVQKDAESNELLPSLIASLGGADNTIESSMQKIVEYTKIPLIFKRLSTGNFLCFTAQEASTEYIDGEESKGTYLEKLTEEVSEYYSDRQSVTYFGNCIPAVYNINVDAMATIVCPFFTLLEPFQKAYFASRYALSSKISYYADFTPEITEFTIINMQVSFATVEDVNEMQIKAIANRKR